MVHKKGPPSVLIVDNLSDTRVYLYELLASEGFLVTTAADGFEALKIVARCKPDLAIVDLRMPQMKGMELLTRLKAAAPETKVLMLTAYGNFDLYREAVAKGAEDLLLKPIKHEELLRVVHKVLKPVTKDGVL